MIPGPSPGRARVRARVRVGVGRLREGALSERGIEALEG
jgi:hypothetical protein